MLRWLALVLLLANGAYFAWSAGYLRPYGWGPAQHSEPQRLSQQVHPEAIQILSDKEFKRVQEQVEAEKEPRACLQAGPFDDVQAAVLRRTLGDALPPGAWQLEQVPVSPRWVIYVGPFQSSAHMARKRAELTALRLHPEPLEGGALEAGFSLGVFDTQEAADAALAKFAGRVRAARVVQMPEAGPQFHLKLPAVRAEWQLLLADLRPALAGQALNACH